MRKVCAMFLAALLVACTGDPAGNESVATWTVDAKPLLEIDTNDSLQAIGNVNGVARFADGRVAVGDQSNSVIKFYDASGRFMKNVGRAGSGPGEFEMFGEMHHCGDSLLAHDFSNRTFSVISSDGVFGRRVVIALPDSVRSTFRSVCSASGKFLTAGWDVEQQGRESTGPARGPIPFWISDASGEFTAALPVQSSSEKWISADESGIIVVGPRPLGKQTWIAIGTTKAYVGTADSGLINVYSHDGAVLPPLRFAAATPAVTSADIEAFKLRDTIGIRDEYREMWLQRMAKMKYPDRLPAYSAMLIDSEQHVWVRSFPAAAAKVVNWSVFSDAGDPVATVALPGTFTVHEVGRDYLAGVDADPMTGEQRVLVLSLRRGR